MLPLLFLFDPSGPILKDENTPCAHDDSQIKCKHENSMNLIHLYRYILLCTVYGLRLTVNGLQKTCTECKYHVCMLHL